MLARNMQTEIPGFHKIEVGFPSRGNFVAMAADMRDSTDHLLQLRAGSRVMQLQRIFYETSALLPCLAEVVKLHSGKVTEYLGDGVLALFYATDDKEATEETIREAYRASKDCLDALYRVVNPIISQRYLLPSLEMGIGLALSQAIVTTVGLPQHEQPKVFGNCVFHATKLAKSHGDVYCDEAMNIAWPMEKNGGLKFIKGKIRGHDGYKVAYPLHITP